MCEFDPYAVTSYNAIHGTTFETSDVKELNGNDLGIVDTDKFTYLLTYSYPCQSLSIAGKQEGMIEGSGTQSSLLWEVKRLLQETENLPQILVMENVKQVLSKKNVAEFRRWIDFLKSLGYQSKYQVLNAKDYGVPQNRERCFMVSWLGDYFYDFPQPKPLEKVLRDLLQDESEIDDKYYLSEKGVQYVMRRDKKYTQVLDEQSQIAPAAITAVGNANWTGNFIKCEQVAQLDGTHEMSNRVYSPNGLCPTIRTMSGGGLEPKIMTENPQIKVVGNYSPSGHDASRIVSVEGLAPTVKENYGTVTAIHLEPKLVGGYGKKKSNGGRQWYQQDRVYGTDGVAMCHPANLTGGSYNYYVGDNDIQVYDMYNAKQIDSDILGTITSSCSHQGSGTFCIKKPKSPIRKLTQKECFRLMNFDDVDYENARKSLNETYYNGKDKSGSQLYKQAGNSIVVAVLEAIFKEML